VHVARAHLAAIFGPFLRDERASYRLFTADPYPAQDTERGELPDIGDQAAEKREQRITENGQHQRAHTAKAIGHRPPHHRQAPAEQEQREQHAAVVHNVAGRGGDARTRQQLAQRGHEHDRVNRGVHAVERPAAPRRPEPANLVSIQFGP
jgi:hypothetical protein